MPDRAWFLSRCYRVAYQLLRVYWFVARPAQHGVKCVILRGEEVLLVRHTYGNRREWELPGGGVKRGEEPIEAAGREAEEELGVAITAWSEIGTLRARSERRQHTLHFFRAEIGEAVPVPDRVEIAEARWFPASALPTPIGRFARRMIALCEPAGAEAA